MMSWPFAISMPILLIIAFALSNYFKELRDKIQRNEFHLKDRDIGNVLFQHLGEVGLSLLLFEKLDSSTINIPSDYIKIWAIIQIYVVCLLVSAVLYSYGKLMFILLENNLGELKTLAIVSLSVLTVVILALIN